MAKQIAKLLKASIQDSSDLKQIAKQLAGKGRGGDTMLVHITPKEAGMLKASGGAGTINPDTGLLEFYDGGFNISDYADFEAPNIRTGGYATKAQPELSYGFNAPSTYEYSDPTAQMATRQYAGSAFPYQPATGETDPTGESMTAQAMGEFPVGMSARASLGAQPYAPTTYFTPTDFVNPFQNENLRPDLTPPVRSVDEGLLGRVGKFLTREGAGGVTPLERLGVAGLSALPGVLQARQAAQQGQRYREDLQRLAAPYQEQGKRLVEQAQRGELTAPNQQQIQAMQARMAQGVATRGGVGAEQAQVQLEAFRQQLLANQFDLGLKVSGIGDQIATGAIKSGLQADQYVSELTNSYFNNAFRMAMGGGAVAPGR
jgi:hypothetical protein